MNIEYRILNIGKNLLTKIPNPNFQLHLTQTGFIRFTKKTLISILAAWTVFVATGLVYLFVPGPWRPKAEAAWFDDNWAYRQIISLTNTGSTQTNYQVAVYVDTQTLIAAGKLQTNCNDLRFTDIN